VVGVGVGVPFAAGSTSTTSTGNVVQSKVPIPEAFTRPLTIPAVLKPDSVDASGER
jgi:spore coat protein A